MLVIGGHTQAIAAITTTLLSSFNVFKKDTESDVTLASLKAV